MRKPYTYWSTVILLRSIRNWFMRGWYNGLINQCREYYEAIDPEFCAKAERYWKIKKAKYRKR